MATVTQQREMTPAQMLDDAVAQAKAKQSPEERMADYGAWYIDSLAADRDDVFLKKQSERLFGVEMPEDRLKKDRSVFNKARQFVDMYSKGEHVTEKGDEFLTSIPKEQQDEFLRALQAVGTKQDVDTEGLSRVSRRLTRGAQQVGTSTAKFMDQFGLLPEHKGKSAEEVIDFSRNVQGALAGMDPAKAESWLGEAGLKAAEMFPAMAVSTLGGMKGIGQRAGNWAFWTAQTQPQQEWLMEEHNVDPETAKLWSWIGGMASAAVEQLGSAQLRGVKPSNPTLRNFVKENLIEWGAKEWLGEEGSQAMIELAADAIARKTGGGDPMDWDKEFHDKLTELMETGAPLAILMGPGAAVRGVQTYGEGKARQQRFSDIQDERVLRSQERTARQDSALTDEEASRLLDTFAKEATEPPTTQRTETESQGRPEDLAKEPGWEETPARPERVREAQQRLTQLEAMMEKGYVAKEEAQQEGIPGENRKERLANAQQEAARLRQEIEDASTVRSPETEVREEQGRQDVRGERQEQVPTEQEGQVPEAREGQVEQAPVQERETPNVGQYVQWTSQGTNQFTRPRRVTGVSEDGTHVFVEGTTTGIPTEQTTPASEAEVQQAVEDEAETQRLAEEQELKSKMKEEVNDWKRRTRRRGGRTANLTRDALSKEVNKALKALGLRASDNLSPSGIQKAYRNASLKAHPDAGGSPAQMATLNRAKELLDNAPATLDLAKRKWQREHGAPAKPQQKPTPEQQPDVETPRSAPTREGQVEPVAPADEQQPPGQPAATKPSATVGQPYTFSPEQRAERVEQLARKQFRDIHARNPQIARQRAEEVVEHEQNALQEYPVGTKLEIEGYKGSLFEVRPDGTLFDINSRRVMGDNAGAVLRHYKPEQITTIAEPEAPTPKRTGRKDQGKAKPAPAQDYPQIKKEELKAEAKRRGLKGYSTKKKDAIIAMLEQDDQRQAAEATPEEQRAAEEAPGAEAPTEAAPNLTQRISEAVKQLLAKSKSGRMYVKDLRDMLSDVPREQLDQELRRLGSPELNAMKFMDLNDPGKADQAVLDAGYTTASGKKRPLFYAEPSDIEQAAETPAETEAPPAPKPGTKPSSTDYMQQMVDADLVRKEDAPKKTFDRQFRSAMPNNRWLSLPEIAARFRNETEARGWAKSKIGPMVEAGLLDRMYRSDGTPVYAWKGAETERGLLTQAEADQTMPTDAPTETEAPPVQETRREPTRQRADRPSTETISELGETGATSNLNLADNTSQQVQYVAIDADQVTPSHDARRNFARNEEGDWNERPYHDPVEGASSRATVEQIAQADPGKLSLLVSDNTTPTDGPAMTTPDGVVLGGNARAMAIQLAYQRGGEAAQRMKQTMVDAAQKFGMDPEAVRKMDRPIIVRVLSKVGDRGEMSAILNESLTAGKSQATVAASRGTRVGQDTAELISQYMAPRGAEDGRSLRDVLSDPKRSRRVIDRLRTDGVFTQKDLDQYLDSDGMLNDEGKLAVEQALLGRVIADPSTLGDMAKSTRRNTLSAIGPLVRIMSDPTHGERFTEIIRNTIASLPAYVASEASAEQYYIKQTTLMPQPGQGDKAVGILADAIRTRGPVQFRKAIDEIARSLGLKSDTGGQMSMFETTQRADSVDAALTNQFGDIKSGRKAKPKGPSKGTTFGQDVSEGPGITPTVPLTGERGGIGKSVRHFFQRFFATRGELPETAYRANVRREGRIARQMNELRNAAVDFRRGIKKALGGKELTQADVERMNDVLRGEADPTTVPAEVRQPIKAMRDHIDALSRRLIAAGVAQGDLVGIITENMGVYATRSYRVFTDPKWRNKVPDPIRNRALAAIRELYPDASAAEHVGILESLLFRGAADSPVALLRGSKLGSKDLGIFMRRQDVPQWLRELWGEYKEPGVNYARSIFKMSHLWANHLFLNEVREAGLDTWLRSEEDGPIVNEFGDVITQIAAEGSSVMAPLNGMYTTPEIKRAFEGLDAPRSMPEWLRVLMGVNYAVKYGKTVGSAMTHVRNTVSNIGFMIQNGHWRINKAGKAIWATTTGTFQLSDAEFREYYNRLVELGIVGEDVRAGELKDALRDASQVNNIDEFLYNREARHAKKAAQAGRATLRFLNALYQAEDGVAKIYGFENEKARYAKAHPKWSQQQVEEHCADIVRNTFPTYSKIPAGIKAIRRFPLRAPFVSFISEVARNTFHSVKLGYTEMQAPETRGIGAQRLAGNAIAMGAVGILSRGTMYLLGISDEEDDDLRWFVPPWQENSQFLYTAQPKGSTYRFVDLGYTDPHTYLKAPVRAFMSGDNWKDRLGKSAAEALAPFTNEEILSSALMDLRSNEDNKVYNPKDEVGEQAKDIVAHMWTQALEPGTISSVRRIHEAATGRTPRLGVKTEIAALFTGFRFQKVDVEHSLGFRVRDFGKALTDIQRIARKTATTRGTATGEMVATDKARMERLRLAEFAEMQRIIGAARRCGVPRDNLESMLKDNLPDDVAQDLMTGDYSQYELSPQTVRRMMVVVRPPDWEKTADVAVKYPEEFKEYQEAFMERFVGWHGDKASKAAQEYTQQRLGSLPYKEPSREDYETNRKYANAMKEYEEDLARIKHELELLAISHGEAQKALVDSFHKTNTKGEKITEFVKGTKGTTREDLKPSYEERAASLDELYGKPTDAWRQWRRQWRESQ